MMSEESKYRIGFAFGLLAFLTPTVFTFYFFTVNFGMGSALLATTAVLLGSLILSMRTL